MVEVVFVEPNISKEDNEVLLKNVIEVLESIALELQEKREA